MSVMLFKKDWICKVFGMMKFHWKIVEETLQKDETFEKYLTSISDRHSDLGKYIQQAEEKFIHSMMLWTISGNELAYAAQYSEKMDFTDILTCDLDFKTIKSVECSEKQLYSDIGAIIYNLKTNDGNILIPEAWFNSLNHFYINLNRYVGAYKYGYRPTALRPSY